MIQFGVYKHYKGNYYRVIGIACHSETLEDMVVYQGLDENGGLWVRPASMWEEQVGDVQRFTYVGEEDEVR